MSKSTGPKSDRLTIAIEPELLRQGKLLARGQGISFSKLVCNGIESELKKNAPLLQAMEAAEALKQQEAAANSSAPASDGNQK